jgi:hypothetical protein
MIKFNKRSLGDFISGLGFDLAFSALIAIALLAACKPAPLSHSNATNAATKQWPYVEYTKVVAYYFPKAGRGDDSTVMDPQTGGLDEAELQRVKQQEKTLNSGQIARLLRAGFASKVFFNRAACYDAHHVVVFYDRHGKAVAACEFCLECKAFTEWPVNQAISHQYNQQVDFVELAKLCAELGLKLEPSREIENGPQKGQKIDPGVEGVIERIRQEQRPAK